LKLSFTEDDVAEMCLLFDNDEDGLTQRKFEAGFDSFKQILDKGTPVTKVDLPEATKIGITLRGLHKLEKKICELVKQGEFEGVGSYDKLTTENLVYTWVKLHTGDRRLVTAVNTLTSMISKSLLFSSRMRGKAPSGSWYEQSPTSFGMPLKIQLFGSIAFLSINIVTPAH